MRHRLRRPATWWGWHLIASLGLAAIAGIACYVWMAHDLGGSCGVSPRFPQFGPSFDYVRAYVVFVIGAAAVNSVLVALTRSIVAALGAALMTAAATFGGVTFAMFMFLGNRNCFL